VYKHDSNEIKHGGFAGTVGPNQTKYRFRWDRERNVANSAQSAEVFGHVLEYQIH
jgi:hypothetical protein